jgi:hypothetical protein
MAGNRLLVGGIGSILTASESNHTAYLFDTRSGDQIASLRGYGDDTLFGKAAALTDTQAFIGAWGADFEGPTSGAVFVFPIPEPSTIILLLLGTLGIPWVRRVLCRPLMDG